MSTGTIRTILLLGFAAIAAGCSSNGSRSALPQLPMAQSVSPALIPPAPMAD